MGIDAQAEPGHRRGLYCNGTLCQDCCDAGRQVRSVQFRDVEERPDLCPV